MKFLANNIMTRIPADMREPVGNVVGREIAVRGDAKSNQAPLWSMIDGPTSTFTATIAAFFQDMIPR
jgi:hypothetical protein